jgi:hypothetical protein
MQSNNQKTFFENLKKVYQGNIVNLLMDVLSLKKTAAYCKIKGESQLTFDEIQKLGLHLNLSLDNIVNDDPRDKAPFLFYSNSIKANPKSYIDYLKFTSYQMQRIKDVKNLEITYLSPDIPLVFLLQFPFLLSFKMYMWDITKWQINSTYEDNLIIYHATNQDFINEAINFYEAYIQKQSCEVISSSLFQNTYKHLQHCIEKSYIKNDLVLSAIFNDIKALTNYINEICSNGSKYSINNTKIKSKKFDIYLNDLSNENEFIFAKGNNLQVTFNTFETPHFLRSEDKRVCNYVEKAINSIKNQSICLNAPQNNHKLNQVVSYWESEADTNYEKLLKIIQKQMIEDVA